MNNGHTTNIKGAVRYSLTIPSMGKIEFMLTGNQALALVADLEGQLDAHIPRSLRTEPASIREVEILETLQDASYALRRALNDSATTTTLTDALKRVERVLDSLAGQS